MAKIGMTYLVKRGADGEVFGMLRYSDDTGGEIYNVGDEKWQEDRDVAKYIYSCSAGDVDEVSKAEMDDIIAEAISDYKKLPRCLKTRLKAISDMIDNMNANMNAGDLDVSEAEMENIIAEAISDYKKLKASLAET